VVTLFLFGVCAASLLLPSLPLSHVHQYPSVWGTMKVQDRSQVKAALLQVDGGAEVSPLASISFDPLASGGFGHFIVAEYSSVIFYASQAQVRQIATIYADKVTIAGKLIVSMLDVTALATGDYILFNCSTSDM
jgi:hypothetical protein